MAASPRDGKGWRSIPYGPCIHGAWTTLYDQAERRTGTYHCSVSMSAKLTLFQPDVEDDQICRVSAGSAEAGYRSWT